MVKMTLRKGARQFIEKYSEDGEIKDQALAKYVRSTSVAASSLNIYLRSLHTFTERYQITPQQLYDLRLEELRSDDPMDWDQVQGMIKQIMRELEDGQYSGDPALGVKPWPAEALQTFKEVRQGKPPKAKSPKTCHHIARAVSSFFEAFGSRFELTIKAKDMPQGNSQGAKPIQIQQLAEVVKHPGEENPHRNVAVCLFLKAWGPRRGDLGLFKIRDYLEAKTRPYYNEYGEVFVSFDAVRTGKEGILGRPHLGPEAIEALDRYLEIERPGADPEEPLFLQHSKKYGTSGPITSASVGALFKNMTIKALGEKAARNISAHSIRKTWVTMIQAGGLPEIWAKYIQGKATVYNVPKELEGPDGQEILMSHYMRAYDEIRVYGHDQAVLAETKDKVSNLSNTVEALATSNVELEEKIQTIEAEREEDREMDQAWRLIFRSKKGRQLMLDLLEKLEKDELDE